MTVTFLASALVGALALHAAAAPLTSLFPLRQVPTTHRVHERGLPHWDLSWTKHARVPADLVLPMRIGLRQSNLERGHDRLMDMANPASPNFGRHMTPGEVIDFFAPSEERVRAVTEWLAAEGIEGARVSLSENKQWIRFDATAAEVEELLFAEYHIFEHASTGSQSLACDQYHLPADVQEHVDYIVPGIRLRKDPSQVQKLKRRAQLERLSDNIMKRGIKQHYVPDGAVTEAAELLPLNGSVCYRYVTPECVRTQYGIPEGTKAAPGNELGIYESLNDHYSKEDLDGYFSNVYPKIPNGTYPTEKLIDGAIGAAQTLEQIGGESALDFQSAMPLIWPQKAVLFQVDDQYYEIDEGRIDSPLFGFFNTFFDALDGSYCNYSAYGETGDCTRPECLDPSYPDGHPGGYAGERMCGVYPPTHVISISYGGGEADVPASYLRRQCSEVLKLGLQGVTVVQASGDDGVGSYPGDFNLTTGCAGPTGRVFYPSAISTCPYVLSVGSTQLDNTTAAPQPGAKLAERATATFASGGGFSNTFDTPLWQVGAVARYFETVKLNFTGYLEAGTNFSAVGTGVYKIGGRGYPDVAAVGSRYIVRLNGTWERYGGTSLSAPVWASVLTLINEERIAAGKHTLGFVTPILYEHPEVFNDITVGSNPNCQSTGFLAAKGWDPVTGLG